MGYSEIPISIEIDPKRMGGQPCLRGQRILIALIAEYALDSIGDNISLFDTIAKSFSEEFELNSDELTGANIIEILHYLITVGAKHHSYSSENLSLKEMNTFQAHSIGCNKCSTNNPEQFCNEGLVLWSEEPPWIVNDRFLSKEVMLSFVTTKLLQNMKQY